MFTKNLSLFSVCVLAVAAALFTAGPARAATGTWTGSAGATWDTTDANWSGVSGTPWDSGNGPANAALFTGSPTPSVSGTVYAGGFYVGSGSGTSTTLGISNGTLNLGGGTEWVAIGGKRKGGVGTTANSCTLTITGGNVNFLNNGAGTVYFNPYGGTASTLNLNGGTVSTVTGFTDGAGSGSDVNFNGGTLKFTAAPTRPFDGSIDLYVQAGGAIFDTGGNNVTIDNHGGAYFPLKHSGTGTDGGLTKIGSGTLTLVNANTYNGATKINTGTLKLGASSSGVIPTLGSIATSSSIEIGAGATFDVTSLASYTVPSTGFAFDLPTTGSAGLLDATGTTLNLNSAAVGFNYTTLNQPTYVLAKYGTLSGTFSTVAPTGYTYAYGGNQVALEAIPEPSALSLLGLFGGASLLRRRLRRRNK